ncbi:NUDIX domain-containing protein [Candidatus Pacearchaeota archaeon]|nr:NUDIX domain-containing protein [Candidatus Pacearchaeota archaeon]
MIEEIIDIVNENDEVIGMTTKSQAHSKGLLHRITAILILNNKDDLLIQKRAKNHTGGELYDFSAAGHVLHGEEYEEAAQRELQEELGINIKLTKIREGLKSCNENLGRIKHIYPLFIGFDNGPFRLQETEVASVEFIPVSKLNKMVTENPYSFCEGFKVGLKTYLNWYWSCIR